MSFSSPPKVQRAFNVPAAILWLIVGLAAAHMLRTILPNGEDILFQYGFVPARYSSEFLAAHNFLPVSLWDRAVPFISYMALHGDFTHLGINLLWLLAFGPVVARRFGAGRFFLFFLICGVTGALVHLAVNWGSQTPVIGASAAISGLMAAGMRMMPQRAPVGHAPANDPALAPFWSSRVLMFSGIWLLLNAVVGMTGMGMGADGEFRVIAWEAHMGGYIAGYLLAGPFDHWAPSIRHV